MTSLVSTSLVEPTEVREFPNGRLELFDLEGSVVGRFVLGPGWRWSNDVAPLAGTDSCQQRHVGYVVSGSLEIATDDGMRQVLSAGQVAHIAPGHDAWTVGEESVVLLDFADVSTYALGAEAAQGTG